MKNKFANRAKERMDKTMKKLLSTMLVVVIAIFMLGTVSNATTKNELKEYMTSEKGIAGSRLIIRSADKVKLERFFADNEISDEQAGEIKNLIDQAISYMTEDGADQPNEMSTPAKRQELIGYAQQAAKVLGLTVSYDATETRLDIYRDGEFIDSLYWGVLVEETTPTKGGEKANGSKAVKGTTEPSLAKTGSTNYGYAIAAGVILIAGITLVVARKKGKNAVA